MSEKQLRFRSPPYPYVGLAKALEKAEQLYLSVRHHAAAIPTAAKAWDTGPKSSATLQSVAALIQYGLLDDEGSGDARKIKLTQLALKIVTDKRPGSPEREMAIKEAALKPKTFEEIYAEFGPAEGIDDGLLSHSLTAERVQQGRAPFSDQSAADVIRVYRDTMSYAKISEVDKQPDEVEPLTNNEQSFKSRAQLRPHLAIGNYVQWVSAGMAQFIEPRRVRALSDDGNWAFIDGSETGIPTTDLELVASPAERANTPPRLALPENDPTVDSLVDPRETNRMKVVWEGKLIHINATVDKEGLAKLRAKLDAMETLLEDE